MNPLGIEIFKAKEEYGIKEVKDTIEKKFESKRRNYKYVTKSEQYGNDVFKFYFYFAEGTNNNSTLYWYEKMKNLFDDLDDYVKTISSAYGVLIIEGNLNPVDLNNENRIIYILTFGNGIHMVGECVDLNFGLEFASKSAKVDSINTQSSKFFSINKNKSLVIYNNASFNTQVGEAVDYLIADIEEVSGRSAIRQLLELVNKRVHFSNYVKMTLKEKFNSENLIRIIKNVNTIITGYRIRFSIPKLYYLKDSKDKKIIKKLQDKLNKDVLDIGNTSISLGIYSVIDGRFETTNNQDECRLYVGRKGKEYGELNLENVRNFIEEFNILDITKINARIGNDTYPLCKLIDYTTSLENEDEYYCLNSGRWTRFNKEYIIKVEEEIENKINKITVFDEKYNLDDLQKLRMEYSKNITGKEYSKELDDKLYRERVYNYYLMKRFDFMLMDRELEEDIEIADLFDRKEKALIHVKIGNPAKFIECINQSMTGATHYVNNKKQVIKKFGNELKNVRKITLLFVLANNKKVWEERDMNIFESLRLKLNLLEWLNRVQELNFDAQIIIAKKGKNG